MASDIKLKPCPFCGRDVKWQRNDIGYFIKCCNFDECLITPESVYAEAKGFWRTKEEVAAAWNKRVVDERVQSIFSRVHDFLGEIIRDGLIEDTPRASDLADDVWDVLRNKDIAWNRREDYGE